MLAWAASARKENAGVMLIAAVFGLAGMLNAGFEMMRNLVDGAQNDHGHAG